MMAPSIELNYKIADVTTALLLCKRIVKLFNTVLNSGTTSATFDVQHHLFAQRLTRSETRDTG